MASMLRYVAKWWNESRQWKQEHVATFAAACVRNSDGTTVLQRRLIASIAEVMPEVSFERELEADGVVRFAAQVPNTKFRLYVYPNEAGFMDTSKKRPVYGTDWRPFEEWDFRTPDELISAVTKHLTKLRAG